MRDSISNDLYVPYTDANGNKRKIFYACKNCSKRCGCLNNCDLSAFRCHYRKYRDWKPPKRKLNLGMKIKKSFIQNVLGTAFVGLCALLPERILYSLVSKQCQIFLINKILCWLMVLLIPTMIHLNTWMDNESAESKYEKYAKCILSHIFEFEN